MPCAAFRSCPINVHMPSRCGVERGHRDFRIESGVTAKQKRSSRRNTKGDPISIGFNSSYVWIFSRLQRRSISIELKDEPKRGQMRRLADESYRYRYIISRCASDLERIGAAGFSD